MSTKNKKPEDIVPRLLEWQRIYDQWQAQYNALDALMQCGSEAPLTLPMWQMWEAYTNVVAREVGDHSDWLGWYCWDNGMGANGLGVKSASGKTIRVRTVTHLARVICE